MINFITGLQPTGDIHLGNYLGAIDPAAKMLEANDGCVFVADYHAITDGHDPKELRQAVSTMVSVLVGCGIDHDRIFVQSDVPEHAELAWILQATASRVGWLNRMVQFKNRMENLPENGETPSVGLYTYPVLQAADILAHGARLVPVGDDQFQHLNLVVDIAEKFNREFGETFVVPTAVRNVTTRGRIMSLTEPDNKMSKSADDPNSRIHLTDSDDVIAKKVKRATSDTELLPDNEMDLVKRHAAYNLVSLYAGARDIPLVEAIAEFAGKGYGALKPALADALIEMISPIRDRAAQVDGQRSEVATAAARERAATMLARAKEAIGI